MDKVLPHSFCLLRAMLCINAATVRSMKCFDGLTEALLDVDSLRSCNAFHA